MVAHHSLAPRLDGLALRHLQDRRLRRRRAAAALPGLRPPGLQGLGEAALHGDAATLDDSAVVEHWDIQSIIYTSGTTGASKGVLSPYLQSYTTAMVVYGYCAMASRSWSTCRCSTSAAPVPPTPR
jgi:carnitine-CoA ligase